MDNLINTLVTLDQQIQSDISWSLLQYSTNQAQFVTYVKSLIDANTSEFKAFVVSMHRLLTATQLDVLIKQLITIFYNSNETAYVLWNLKTLNNYLNKQ